MGKARALLGHTLLLTLTTLILRTAAVSFNVYLTNRVGTVGIGLLQLIMTTYSFTITLASSGIRLAATRIIVTAESEGKDSGRVVLFCVGWGFLLGTAVALGLFAVSESVSTGLLGHAGATPSLRILALGVPFVSMSSALGGYFTAVRQIPRQAAVQVFEELVQIGVTVVLLRSQSMRGLDAACAAIVTGICLSEVASFVCSWIVWRYSTRSRSVRMPHRRFVRRFFHIALPDAASAVVGSTLRTAQNLLIPVCMRRSGADDATALAAYGVIQGMALPLLLYPSAIISVLSGLLVPELAEALLRGQTRRISALITRVLRLTALFSIGIGGFAFGFSEEIALAVYHSTDTAVYLRLFAPLMPLMYLDLIVDGMLKGLDQQLRSMFYNIIDAALGVLLVCTLIPRYALGGFILTVFAARTLNALLSLHRLLRVGQISMDLWKTVFGPICCAVIAQIVADRMNGGILLSVGVFWGGYLLLLLLFRCWSDEDLRWAKSIIK